MAESTMMLQEVKQDEQLLPLSAASCHRKLPLDFGSGLPKFGLRLKVVGCALTFAAFSAVVMKISSGPGRLIGRDAAPMSHAEVDMSYNLEALQALEEKYSDLKDICDFRYPGGEAEMCFCKLAGNAGCEQHECTCPQGCEKASRDDSTASFYNRNRATGCVNQPHKAVLTIPRSFFSSIRALHKLCPGGMYSLVTLMIQRGFLSYGGGQQVRHCIHSADHVSNDWFHLHTFCADGQLDGLPSNWHVGWCGQMDSLEQASTLAASVVEWAQRLYGPLSEDRPLTCKELGCWGKSPEGYCSCDRSCLHSGDCCDDHDEVCSHHQGPSGQKPLIGRDVQ